MLSVVLDRILNYDLINNVTGNTTNNTTIACLLNIIFLIGSGGFSIFLVNIKWKKDKKTIKCLLFLTSFIGLGCGIFIYKKVILIIELAGMLLVVTTFFYYKKLAIEKIIPINFTRKKEIYCTLGATLFLAALLFLVCSIGCTYYSGFWVYAIIMQGAIMTIFCFEYMFLVKYIQYETLKNSQEEMLLWQSQSKDYMNTIRAQRHDFNFHLQAILGLVENHEYEKCGEYVREMVKEANDVNDIMPISDAVVGAMLLNMRKEARQKESDIFYDITYDLNEVLCTSFECNKIIGNLIQNAIDALKSDKSKRCGIHVSIFKRGTNAIIVVENYFEGNKNDILRCFDEGFTTKKNHQGIGLAMVKRLIEVYGGRIYPEFSKDNIRFVVNIPKSVDI